MTDVSFGALSDGRQVRRVTLETADICVSILTYGARIQSVRLLRPTGVLDVLPGFETVAEYEVDEHWFGALAGPIFGRVPGGTFELAGETIQLPVNKPGLSLHAGNCGYHSRIFSVEKLTKESVTLYLQDVAGECGLPGNVAFRVTYSLEGKSLRVRYHATTDQTTAMCVNVHMYLNLAGIHSGTVKDHLVQIHSGLYLGKDASSCSDGTILSVVGTPVDLREPTRLGDRISQFPAEDGFDHSFVVAGDKSKVVAVISAGDVSVQVSTNQLCFHLYTANYFDGTKYPKYGAVCLECQGFAGSVNYPHFPSILLRPGETYDSDTVYAFKF